MQMKRKVNMLYIYDHSHQNPTYNMRFVYLTGKGQKLPYRQGEFQDQKKKKKKKRVGGERPLPASDWARLCLFSASEGMLRRALHLQLHWSRYIDTIYTSLIDLCYCTFGSDTHTVVNAFITDNSEPAFLLLQ